MEFTSEQIHILLIEKLAGTIDPEDNVAIELLLAENAKIRQQWLDMKQAVEESEDFALQVSETQRWQEVKSLLHEPGRTKSIPLNQIASIAAILTAVIVGIYLFVGEQPPVHAVEAKQGITLAVDNGKMIPIDGAKTLQLDGATIQVSEKELTPISSRPGSQQWGTLTVPAVLDYKVRLADGSEVWLNAETKLRFPFRFSGQTREVYIDGEAYFKVAKNSRQPFIVHTPQTDIQVTGTTFNVNTYNKDNVQTALVEGSVVTRGAGATQVAIKPGFVVTYNAQKGFRTEVFDEAEVLSWMKGVYYFHDTSLRELAKVLSRWYGIEVRFDNVALQNKTFSGELMKQQPLQLFLDNLKLSAEVRSSVRDGVVYLK